MKAHKRPPKKQEGQILVLMALLSTTLVILFGMVVGVGHLIQAKMNLQNATDFAAMAGASWQARHMNHLALVNYRLRQNYKFQLYDFYVTASRFNRGLRNQLNGGGIFDRVPKNQTAFGICQQSFGFDPNFRLDNLVSDGSPMAADTDYCQNVVGAGGVGLTIPPILPSPVPNLNPILIAANLAIINLSRRLRDLCGEASGQNRTYFDIMTRALDKRQRFQVREMIKVLDEFDRAFSTGPLVQGGRSGDELILRTLNANLIAANKTGAEVRWLSPNETRAFRVGNVTDLEAKIFRRDSAGDQFANYFERQRVQFTFPYVDFGNNCSTVVRVAQSQGDPTIVGIARTRIDNPNPEANAVKVPLFVGLEVTVTPRLLFWPQGLTPTLVAVGAAKPFGSRIGPPLEMTNYEILGPAGRNLRNESDLRFAQGNISFFPGDIDDSNQLSGIGHKTILRFLFNALDPRGNGPNSGVRTRRPSTSNPNTSGSCSGANLPFLCLALAPTLYEGLFWNTYQFPRETMDNPLARATFPIELNITPANIDYLLPDRMAGGITPQQAAQWHYTTLIGRTNTFRNNGKPVFFADTVSALSSWTPDHEFNASTVDPTAGGSGNTQPESRQGYSIKLVSIDQACKEVEVGGIVRLEEPLRSYCVPGAAKKVFH